LGDGNASNESVASFSMLVPVGSWKTKPSPLEENTKGILGSVVEGLLHAVADAVVVFPASMRAIGILGL
jgi:hypothetical protein